MYKLQPILTTGGSPPIQGLLPTPPSSHPIIIIILKLLSSQILKLKAPLNMIVTGSNLPGSSQPDRGRPLQVACGETWPSRNHPRVP